MPERIIWTDEEVASLNAGQKDPYRHPYTCGNDRGSPKHRKYAEDNNEGDWGILIATPYGWKCPVCTYTQKWAHGVGGR